MCPDDIIHSRLVHYLQTLYEAFPFEHGYHIDTGTDGLISVELF